MSVAGSGRGAKIVNSNKGAVVGEYRWRRGEERDKKKHCLIEVRVFLVIVLYRKERPF